jgi:catechol 2,3-dioxygenase-like lactoylglutathione lyase family enzyme
MIRPIDHIVLPVRDLGAARRHYEMLGFAVAAEARHPFGTANALIFLADGSYLEPVAIADPHGAAAARREGNPFVEQVARHLEARGEGMALAALKSPAAAADHASFAKAGFAAGEALTFRRMARMPDGGEAEVGFTLAFAADRAAPEAGFFACQHLAAETMWRAAITDHPNTARGLARVALVARSPADFHIFISAVTGQRELRATSFQLDAELGATTLSVFTPVGFRARYGVEAPHPGAGLLFAGLEVAVADLAAAGRFAGKGTVRAGEILSLPPAPGRGAVLAFREAALE